MKLLLDTHVWIWAVQRPDKLSRSVLRQLANPKNELYLSPVSIWEACHLERRGRLKVDRPFHEWIEEILSTTPIREAPFNFVVAARACALDLPQPDIGDLFLAATALVFDLTLVTNDSQLLGFGTVKTLAAN